MRTALAVLFPLFLLSMAMPGRAEPPRVAASIPPVHSLVAMVTGGLTEPALLIPGNASPHDTALRPSAVRALGLADLVVWIGPMLETPLIRPIETLGARAHVLTLADVPDEGRADGQGPDPHLWLDPLAAARWLRPLAEALAVIDPGNAPIYRGNADAAEARLTALTEATEARLAPLAGRAYVVMHDAYRHFEQRFGLAPAVALSPSDATRPGARSIARAAATLRALDDPCIFAEPHGDTALAERLAAETGVRLGVLDPEGSLIAPGPNLYPTLIENLATSLADCLAPPG